jgi:hypothetical protein
MGEEAVIQHYTIPSERIIGNEIYRP